MAILLFFPFSPLSSSFMTGFYTGYFTVVAILSIITIFLYKKRNIQVRICFAIMFLLVLIYAISFAFDRQLLPSTELFQNIRFTFTFPLIAFILVYLALRGVKKDEKLVRSLDRLR
jgi:hypothetical protein